MEEFGSLGGLMRELESAGVESTEGRLAGLTPSDRKNKLGPEVAGRLARFLRSTKPKRLVCGKRAEGAAGAGAGAWAWAGSGG